jgi:sec-independent protein translocase protein TatC
MTASSNINANLKYWNELRYRLLVSVACLASIFIIAMIFASELYEVISSPLLAILPASSQLIATSVTSTFLVPLKLSFLIAVLISIPFILYQIWAFVSPALYHHEKARIFPIVAFSCLLFYLGMAFGFKLICPLALKFFAQCAPKNVNVMTDLGNFLDFITVISISAGIAFQIPVIINIMLRFKIVTKASLKNFRRYFIVLAFILGMLLTPPDVISQILLAIPMIILFELGILFS